MASDQLIKDELLSGSGVSEPSVSSHAGDDESTGTAERAAQLGVTNGVNGEGENGLNGHYSSEQSENDDEDDEEEDEDDEGKDEQDDEEFENDEVNEYEFDGAAEDEDEDLEEDDTVLPSATSKRRLRARHDDGDNEAEDDEDEEEEEESDADGDEGDEDASGDSDEDAVNAADGVGAVKIRPGETDDEDDSEASAAASESSDEEWEENAGNAGEEDDDEEEEEEEADDAGLAKCVVCKQNQPHVSDETGGEYLSCSICGETAHLACARESGSLDQEDFTIWKCPACGDEKGAAADTGDEMDVDDNGRPQTATEGVNGTPSASINFKDSTPKSSPALRGTHNAESMSEDHTDGGSRLLRKRRTSPVESGDGGMSLRKRRKNATDDLSIDGFGDIRGDVTATSSVRSLRIKPPTSSQVSVVKKTRSSLILKIKVPSADLRRITVKKRKYTKRGTAISKKEKKRLEKLAAEGGLPLETAALPAMPSATAYTQPFYSFFDKETDEQKGKPYGGILTEAEADTSKTLPTPDDRRRFDEAKQTAEEEWRARLVAMQSEAEALPVRKKKASGPASQIECIEFGGWEIDTWYAAPYPEEYSRNRVLYICEFCLKYMNSDYVAWRHKLKCPAKHPPGDEIYRHGSVSFFEVDGRKNPVYCQNLCLLAKLFLGSKTLYYDVEPFLFYVLCEYDEFGYHFVGYFSKEKRASSQNNVSCILTLPIHQRKGYGNLLIDFSYLLTRVEQKTGSPEKPLSDMGLVSYRNYWRLVMCRYLLDAVAGSKSEKLGLSIKQISDDTGMTADDVISALEGLRCLVRDPQTGLYAFRVDLAYCQEYVAKWESKKYVTLNPATLTWTPYVMGRGNATNFELGPALTAIAPREEDEEQKAAQEFVASLTNGDSAPADQTVEAALPNDVVSVETVDSQLKGGHGLQRVVAVVLESTEPNDLNMATTGSVQGEDAVESTDALDEDNAEDDAPANEGTQDDDESKASANAGESSEIKIEDDGGGLANTDDHAAASVAPSATGTGEQTHSNGVDGSHRSASEDWASAYDPIPPTRFVVFPTVSTRRMNYTRAPIGRPPGARTGSGTRGRSRYSTGHVRRAVVSSSRPKASNSKKKSGGTGRGPGRWPKGTKKSDYGNAESGPGLPPAWLAARIASSEARQRGPAPSPKTGASKTADNDAKKHDKKRSDHAAQDLDAAAQDLDAAGDEEDAEGEDDPEVATTGQGEGDDVVDAVQVQTPPSNRFVDKRNGLNGAALESGSRGRSSPRLGKARGGASASSAASQQDGDDTVMVDVGAGAA